MNSLADFRAWVLSEAFPERIRASYVNGSIEVDTSPDEYFGHNFPKGEISSQLHLFIKRKNLGFACFDRAYFTHIAADVSTEPDFLFFSHEALASGRVRFLPRVNDRPGSMELEGAPDLIVEIVSDSSVAKDRRRLPAAYFTAGVLEYWLVDA
ncbi:MAG TPA: Uma2 family endonuclease, partial [Pirellulales bacterium]